jgi:tRNA threonylcarbamoyladenosine biosynthesis protein TsaB
MKILAVEFSSDARSAALIECGGPAPVVLGRAVEMAGRRALGLIEEALGQAQCQREDIEILAVGLGPGSYTGIRGAIALAQGFQLARGIRLLGISSVECLAAQAQREQISSPVHVAVDAQRNEFYLARYDFGADGPRETEPLRLASFAEIEALARSGQSVIGPGITQWFPQARNLFPDAAILGGLACGRTNFLPGEKLEPIYLRETAFKKAPPLRIHSA